MEDQTIQESPNTFENVDFNSSPEKNQDENEEKEQAQVNYNIN